MTLVDSHAHLNFSDYADKLESIIDQAREVGVEKIVNIGTSLTDSQEAITLAQTHAGLLATVGLHPNDNPQVTVESVDWDKFTQLARCPKVVAIGECGLDYSRIAGPDAAEEKRRQQQLFARQIEIANQLHLPLSVHLRDAQSDLMELFTPQLQHSRGVFHCFSGDRNYLNWVLALPDFYVSFAGNVTFKNAAPLQELAKQVPLDKLLVETDCPFLAPEPVRGSQNLPANVKITASKLAELKEISSDALAQATTANAEKLFQL